MLRKLLMLLLILIVGICLFPFLANYIEGMTSSDSPPPNENPPPTNQNPPSTNETPPPTNQNPPPTNQNHPPTNTNTNTTYSNYPYPPHIPPQGSMYPNVFLPKGIPQNQIIPGQEDLYILKSQVVPPVCPACNPVVIYKNKQCEACPACARCPEPSFECKKVPNYNAVNNEYLPKPVLNSFSGFGM